MSRSLTKDEKNKVKNLQVSNSIYKNDIKKLLTEIQDLEKHRMELEGKLGIAMGDEYNRVETDLEKINGDIKLKTGKIAYIEGRIKVKEQQIDDIKNIAAREEEQIVKIWDPNSPECRAKFGEAMEELNEKIEPKKKKTTEKKPKSNKPVGDPTKDF
jgi:predicted  nucleic acid-binding Zn-ribbon protein